MEAPDYKMYLGDGVYIQLVGIMRVQLNVNPISQVHFIVWSFHQLRMESILV